MKKVLIFLYVVSCSSTLFAEVWSNTSVSYLTASNFQSIIGDSVRGGRMETISVEHAGGWKYGKNFMFFDMTSGAFDNNVSHKLYAEWAPKLSLSSVTGTPMRMGIIKEVYLAAELNQGENFQATNMGLGVDLMLPGFDFFEANIFSRKDNFNDATYQVTFAWSSDFRLFSLPMVFNGFLDYYGTDNDGTVLITQPTLLWYKASLQELKVGIEMYMYDASSINVSVRVPQLKAMWIW